MASRGDCRFTELRCPAVEELREMAQVEEEVPPSGARRSPSLAHPALRLSSLWVELYLHRPSGPRTRCYRALHLAPRRLASTLGRLIARSAQSDSSGSSYAARHRLCSLDRS